MTTRRLLPNDGRSEQPYLDLVRGVIEEGVDRGDRTGTGTRALHGEELRFDLSDGTLPLLTTKFVPWKKVAHELFWFLAGNTNIRPLLENKVSIWSEWPHKDYVKATGDALTVREFEARVLADDEFAQKWGDLGPVYGKQWRAWQGPDGKVYDQISTLVERIKTHPDCRRLIFTGWNVADLGQMALAPCHLLYQYFVANGKLSCSLYQRSADLALGVPFNIASAALLVHMLAAQTGLKPGALVWYGHDVHLYKNHLEDIQVQLDRTPRAFPKLEFKGHPDSLFGYTLKHLKVVGYDPDPSIKLPVAV